jgi:hypothetical protein
MTPKELTASQVVRDCSCRHVLVMLIFTHDLVFPSFVQGAIGYDQLTGEERLQLVNMYFTILLMLIKNICNLVTFSCSFAKGARRRWSAGRLREITSVG